MPWWKGRPGSTRRGKAGSKAGGGERSDTVESPTFGRADTPPDDRGRPVEVPKGRRRNTPSTSPNGRSTPTGRRTPPTPTPLADPTMNRAASSPAEIQPTESPGASAGRQARRRESWDRRSTVHHDDRSDVDDGGSAAEMGGAWGVGGDAAGVSDLPDLFSSMSLNFQSASMAFDDAAHAHGSFGGSFGAPAWLGASNPAEQRGSVDTWMPLPSLAVSDGPARLPDAELPQLHPDYRLDSELAKEGFAQVWKGTELETGRVVAIKGVERLATHRGDPATLSEAAILQAVAHPQIVALFAAPEFPTCVETLVMEYVGGGDLFDLVQHRDFDCEVHRDFLSQLVSAVAFVHAKGFVHNDIKMENVLVTSDLAQIKLCDFGLSGRQGEVRVGKAQGTKEYMAPELREVGHGVPYVVAASSDVFSLGVVIHAFILAYLPWFSADRSDPRFAGFMANNDLWNDEEWAVLDPDFRGALQGMFAPQAERIPIEAVRAAVEGPWLRDLQLEMLVADD